MIRNREAKPDENQGNRAGTESALEPNRRTAGRWSRALGGAREYIYICVLLCAPPRALGEALQHAVQPVPHALLREEGRREQPEAQTASVPRLLRWFNRL